MKRLWLMASLIVGIGLPGLAQDTTTHDALLGNSPKTTWTTGIGQVVKPVGTPVVKPALSAQQPPAQTPPSPPGAPKAETEEGKLPLEAEKVEGKYKLEGIPEKPKKGKTKEQISEKEIPLSAYSRVELKETVFQPRSVQKPKPIHIPYSELPAVQTIPPR